MVVDGGGTDQEYLRRAYRYAIDNSDDPSTQNGALLITRTGHHFYGANRFPPGVQLTPHRLERPQKYAFMEHAERSAIAFAAREGTSTEGAVLYAPWFACADCARLIICSGIKKVVGYKGIREWERELFPNGANWEDSILAGNEMMDEAGVERVYAEGPLGLEARVLFGGNRVWVA